MLILAVSAIHRQGIIMDMRYYEVAPTKIVRMTNHAYTYSSETDIAIGQLVIIEIGKKTHTGLVLRESKKPLYPTKPIQQTCQLPPLPPELVSTAIWMSEYYSTHLATVLTTILPSGLMKKRRNQRSKKDAPSRNRTHFLLNSQQQLAVNHILGGGVGTSLLHGITGSGKTAVYIELAKHMLKSSKSVIILVPEIALTSQLVAEFQNHFDDIVLTHSRQTEAERHLIWSDIISTDRPRVIVGPRSALFLPLRNIGMIVIDESHEPSFKQDQAPRYSALRVASVLAKAHDAIVVQGSATPLVSEYYLAESTNHTIVHMTKKARTDAIDPIVHVVDMTKKVEFSRHRIFSDKLLDKLNETFSTGKQALIFHNRRGSASTTLCENCGWSAYCPRCFIPFTLHADLHLLRCHVCGNRQKVPSSCPDCQSTSIIHKGIGTKLIESELRKLFPDKNIARFDGDAADDQTVESRYQELYDGSIDIIIGTQVIAKGLDLPKLTTVGIIQADAGLSLPDYTASERTFQLIAQVVGRVGRSSVPTTVVVQSYQPNHPSVFLGIKQDYLTFYKNTIDDRRRGHYPPFVFLLKLTCTYKTESAAIKNAQNLANKLKNKFKDITILGPTPAFYERLRDTYRWQLIIKSSTRKHLIQVLDDVPAKHWQIDLDPTSLL